MSDRKIKIGDPVYLNHNPEIKMTVTNTSGLFLVECSWFDQGGRIQKDTFNRNSLILAEGGMGTSNESLLLG